MRPPKRAKAVQWSFSLDRAPEKLVKCASCSAWVELPDTSYVSIEAADAAPSFTCRQCRMIDIIRAEVALLVKQEAESWKLAVENLTAQLDAEVDANEKRRQALEAKVREEQRQRKALQEQVNKLQRALQRKGS